MPSGIYTNRTNVDLPADIAQEIMQKAVGASAIMKLATRHPLPGRGSEIGVITGDPEAAWVDETAQKPVSNPTLSSKLLKGYKLAVIVPFSNQFRRDLPALYDALIARLPGALGNKFDKTVIGAVAKPGADFDNFAACTAQELVPSGTDTVYGNLVKGYADIATHGGSLTGFAVSPAGNSLLLGSVDSVGRPIFTAGAAEGEIARILNAPVYEGRGLYKAGSAAGDSSAAQAAIVGVMGDWSQAVYGVVEDVDISFSDQATLTINDSQVNLWERNMFAVRAEMEVGFRAMTDVFNILLGATPSA